MNIFYSYDKPKNYDALSIIDKIAFISDCYKKRNKSWKNYHAKFFGGTSDFYIRVIRAIHQYLTQSTHHHSLNNHDLNAAYDIVNQFFLSNNQFFSFVNSRINNPSLSQEFKDFVIVQVNEARRQWNRFSSRVGFDDKDSAEYRNIIKAGSFCCLAAPIVYKVGFFACAVSTAISTIAYTTSGECGDSLAMVSADKRPILNIGYEEADVRLPAYMTMLR